MREALKPTPTEYKGVRFRSKSEAIFARWLGLSPQYCLHRFIYEPEFLRVDDYVPDFYTWGIGKSSEIVRSENGTSRINEDRFTEHIVPGCIEYKPKKPTECYLENLLPKCKIISEVMRRRFGDLGIFRVYYGSPFNDDCGGYYFSRHEDRFIGTEHDWLEGYREELLSYRFDLKH